MCSLPKQNLDTHTHVPIPNMQSAVSTIFRFYAVGSFGFTAPGGHGFAGVVPAGPAAATTPGQVLAAILERCVGGVAILEEQTKPG